jgi:GNAT superfamily N-acetyltransferase
VIEVEQWASDRLDDLVALVEAAMPKEHVSPDELLAVAWEQPGLVAGTPDGDAAVVVASGLGARRDSVSIELLAVHPGGRRRGVATALLDVAEAWAVDHGATELRIGAGGPEVDAAGCGGVVGRDGLAPRSLWPGVDVHAMPAMLCLAEARGYRADGTRLHLSVPVTFRADPPEGVVVRRVITDADERSVLALVADERPAWREPVRRSIDHGSCLGALVVPAGGDDESPVAVGFASHSVDRAGWLGPMGTAAGHRRRGIGSALLSEVARDLMVANFRDMEVTGAEQVRLFVAAGGAVSRVFRTWRHDLPA